MKRVRISITDLEKLGEEQQVEVNRIKLSSQFVKLGQKKENEVKAQILLDSLYGKSEEKNICGRTAQIKVKDLIHCFQNDLGTLNGEIYKKDKIS